MITDRPSNNGATTRTDDAASNVDRLRTLATEKVTDAANYVRERGIKGLSADISDAAARHPLGAVAVSLGIGYVLGRMLTRK